MILGNVANPPDTVNIARVAAFRAGFHRTSAVTVHRNCASSLESVAVATAKIQSGMAQTVIAGGVESMSQVPFLFSREFQRFISQTARSPFPEKLKKALSFRLKFLKPRIALKEALTDSLSGLSMGQTAEVLAREFQITREAQDKYALESHRRAVKAGDKLKEELFPVVSTEEMIHEDKAPNPKLNKEALEKMHPVFDKKYGTVTAGNSCFVSDGSSALILMAEKKARQQNLKPLSRICSIAFCGLEPERMGLGPAYAIPPALERAGLSFKEIGLMEINEAFSAQVLACLKAMSSRKFAQDKLNLAQAVGEADPALLNVNGGAVSIGHPVSATAGRMILTLSKEMKRRQIPFGIAALCIGGGQGGAIVLENAS